MSQQSKLITVSPNLNYSYSEISYTYLGNFSGEFEIMENNQQKFF